MQECRPDLTAAVTIDAGQEEIAPGLPGLPSAPAAIPNFFAGAAWAIFAISIWAGWYVTTRFDVTSGLKAYDLVALRYGVAAIILLPLSLRLRGGIGLIGWRHALAIFAGSGVIYSICSTAGVSYAPASEAAALTPGIMPMATALLSVWLLKERLTRRQLAGFGFILAGVIVIGGVGLFQSANLAWLGHLLFVTGGFLFAGYSIALKRSGLTGLEATALVSLWSSALYIPIYTLALHPRLFDVSHSSLLFSAFYQGVLTNVVSLVAYGRAVSILGASRAAPFAALIPAVTAILSIFILGEFPAPGDWVGIVAVSMGVYLASGAPLPWLSQALQKNR